MISPRARPCDKSAATFYETNDLASPAIGSFFSSVAQGDAGNGTLRWAVDEANQRAGPHSILFDLPENDTTIVLQSVRSCTGPVAHLTLASVVTCEQEVSPSART